MKKNKKMSKKRKNVKDLMEKNDYEYFTSRKKKTQTILKELESHGIDKNKKIKVLEVGCNHGFITYHLANMTSWNMYGGDTNKEHLNKYPFIREKAKISYLDATKMHYKSNQFDVVIYNHVIEHIPEYKKTIDEIYRVLKKGGTLYLATPNLHRKFVRPRILLSSKKNIPVSKRMNNHMGFSYDEITQMLKKFSEIKNINKKHFISNVSKTAGKILNKFSDNFHRKYAQTNVFIAIK